ncbi:hypothetical protein P6144_04070 [Sphingomonas sp. HITSZ_GF]|uniref:hypothetical protein n=1 Tax=Sphingomonas sp. HITSZ_GF TaxID=3037247 RepID=UPI00240E5A52|nr:hypothetical protein [Sphingomonas sp. HITSZ_GF]MDG2532811.1 hypothetical protein [Sphingomonas sp. HITSZ_GF]
MRIDRSTGDYPRKNILTPLLWLNAITFPSAAASFMYNWPLGTVLLIIALVPLGMTLRYYAHWTERDPDRLQTEDYRIQRAYLAQLPQNQGYTPDQIPAAGSKLIEASIGGNRENE